MLYSLQMLYVSVQQKAVVQKIWRDLREKKKTLTEDDKKRKERIFDKVLLQEKKNTVSVKLLHGSPSSAAGMG